MVLQETSSIDQLSARLGLSWPNIKRARVLTREHLAKISGLVSKIPEDCSMVVFGSLARGEATQKSDVDWTLLVDGQSYPSHLTSALQIEDQLLRAGLKEPGKEGTFGGLAFSHDLINYIGGEDDTNSNTTRRLLLLLESSAVNSSSVHSRVITQVVKRYVEEDFGLTHSRTDGVPRFLLNDIARYWRTMAVDFAYKRRERQAKGWAIRTVKLRLSRKLIFVSGLLACYSCSDLPLEKGDDGLVLTLPLIDHLEKFLRQSPLEILANAILPYIESPGFEVAARGLFDSYDAFLRLLDDTEQRMALEALKPEDAANDALYEQARKLGKMFQDGLNVLFLDKNETPLYRLTRAYGVF